MSISTTTYKSRRPCTADDPWKEGREATTHPSAEEIGDHSEGSLYYIRYKCPHCGKVFLEEQPQ